MFARDRPPFWANYTQILMLIPHPNEVITCCFHKRSTPLSLPPSLLSLNRFLTARLRVRGRVNILAHTKTYMHTHITLRASIGAWNCNLPHLRKSLQTDRLATGRRRTDMKGHRKLTLPISRCRKQITEVIS